MRLDEKEGSIVSNRRPYPGRATRQPDSPITFNFGYTDPENQFRTIIAAGNQECPDGCPRRLANRDMTDPETSAPIGIPEGEKLPADNRKTLNATAWVGANFHVSGQTLFFDGFESGDTGVVRACQQTSVTPFLLRSALVGSGVVRTIGAIGHRYASYLDLLRTGTEI